MISACRSEARAAGRQRRGAFAEPVQQRPCHCLVGRTALRLVAALRVAAPRGRCLAPRAPTGWAGGRDKNGGDADNLDSVVHVHRLLYQEGETHGYSHALLGQVSSHRGGSARIAGRVHGRTRIHMHMPVFRVCCVCNCCVCCTRGVPLLRFINSHSLTGKIFNILRFKLGMTVIFCFDYFNCVCLKETITNIQNSSHLNR